jgi:Cu(I)/Ag(I) efflux system membrane fusion protein
MHPGVQQDHPGECPICSMTLVPRATLATPAHEPDGGAPVAGLVPVTVTPDRQQLMGMRTAKVSREPLAPELRTIGTVTPSETGRAVVQSRTSGWIEKLLVTQTGQKVARGQVLATVYSPELLQAQQELLTAQHWAASGTPSDPGIHGGSLAGVAGDARTRLELLGVAAPEIEAIAKSGEPMRAVPIRAPIGGVVVDKPAVQGMAVEPGLALFEIADLSRLWVVADVYEYEMARVTLGQVASFEVAAYPGERFTGKVTFVAPTLDASTRTLRVRVELARADARLKPGMYGNVVLAAAPAEALVVPAEAVVDTGEAQYVFVARDAGRFEPRRVTLGVRSGSKIAVLGGVVEGETVVTTANFLLDSESRLHAASLGPGSADAGTPPPAPGH